MTRVAIIIGRTRPGRKAETVARWVRDCAVQREDASFETPDLADYPLPHLDELLHAAPGADIQQGSHPGLGRGDRLLRRLCLHHPGGQPLHHRRAQNAIDYLYVGWHNKAAGGSCPRDSPAAPAPLSTSA